MRRLAKTRSLLTMLLLSGWMALVPIGCARQSGAPRVDLGKQEQAICSTPAVFADGTLSASQCARIDSAVAAVLNSTGAPTEFVQVGQNLRGGMTFRAFRIKCRARTLEPTQ